VNQTPTTITVDSTHNYPGQNVTLTSHILDYYGNPVNEGQVNFTINSTITGTVNVINGIATLKLDNPTNLEC
jgi:hypothetical protein